MFLSEKGSDHFTKLPVLAFGAVSVLFPLHHTLFTPTHPLHAGDNGSTAQVEMLYLR